MGTQGTLENGNTVNIGEWEHREHWRMGTQGTLENGNTGNTGEWEH